MYYGQDSTGLCEITDETNMFDMLTRYEGFMRDIYE